MKNTFYAMISLVALGLAACSSGTPCDEAASVLEQGFNEACAGQECQFCVCWRNGQNVNSTGDGCVAREPAEPTACEGAALDQANTCLANRTACQAPAAVVVGLACGS